MKPKHLLLSAFILVALIQLYVPYQMISQQAGFAKSGNLFKFKIAHPGSFHRTGVSLQGKFIYLNFSEDHIKISDEKEWDDIQNAFVTFKTDSSGFATIKWVTKTKPVTSSDWVRAGILINRNDSSRLRISYPFNNYYIEDALPKKIASIIKNGINDSTKISYLKIRIKENKFLIDDIYINDIPFKNLVRDSKP